MDVIPQWVREVQEIIEAREMDRYLNYTCPICGTECNEYESCNCGTELHSGKD